MSDVCEGRVTTLCLSMDTVPHSTLHTCTHSHSQHTTVHAHTQCPHPSPHTAPGLHECMHAHTCPHLGGGRGRKVESGWRREEEGSCPYLDLHFDLQVSPVDGEQRTVRAGGAYLPGMVGHVPLTVSRRNSGEKEGTWQEKVPSSAEEGTGDCISSAHHSPTHPTLTPSTHPCSRPLPLLLVVQYWCHWSQ